MEGSVAYKNIRNDKTKVYKEQLYPYKNKFNQLETLQRVE